MNRRKELKRTKRLAAKTELRRAKPLGRGPAKPKATAPRAPRGGMAAAVALVLAGEASVAQAARQFEVDPGRLDDRAWAEAKAIVFGRDSWTCQACGELAVDVHHIIRRGIGGTSDPVIAFGRVNLVALCRACHDLCHKKDRGLYDRGFWMRTTEKPGSKPVRVPGPFGHRPLWLLANNETSGTDPEELVA